MKLQSVKIVKFKCLENIEKEVNGKNLILIGDNETGKSSFIQFIDAILGKNTNIPIEGSTKMINNNGEKIDLSIKSNKAGKSVVTVMTESGLKDNKKSAIASIVGINEFNIDRFVRLSETTAGKKEQVKMYEAFLDPDILKQIGAYKVDVGVVREERTELGRIIKDKKGSIKENSLYNEVGAGIVFQPVDISAITQKMTEANKSNATIEIAKSRIKSRTENNDGLDQDIKAKESEIFRIKQEIEIKKIDIENNNFKIGQANEYLEENKIIDISDFQKEIDQAAEKNKKAEQAAALIVEISEVKKLEDESGEMTALIGSKEQAIEDSIKDIDGPIDGLGYGEDGSLSYNGIPVSINSMSTSAIMELGIRLKMAENPELGILFIERGESLGEDRLKMIKEIADKNNFQIIMEQVERGKEKLTIQIMEG